MGKIILGAHQILAGIRLRVEIDHEYFFIFLMGGEPGEVKS